MLRILSISVLALLLGANIGVANAQSRNAISGSAAGSYDLIVSTAGLWGGTLGVYSCDQWRRYVTDLFNRADRYHRGYIDEKQAASERDT